MSHARLSPLFCHKGIFLGNGFWPPLIKIWSTLFGSPSSISSNTLSVTTSPFSPMKKTTRRDDGDISGRILNRKLDITPTLWTLTHWRSILPRVITWWKKESFEMRKGWESYMKIKLQHIKLTWNKCNVSILRRLFVLLINENIYVLVMELFPNVIESV